jgi:hypothetical protein
MAADSYDSSSSFTKALLKKGLIEGQGTENPKFETTYVHCKTTSLSFGKGKSVNVGNMKSHSPSLWAK